MEGFAQLNSTLNVIPKRQLSLNSRIRGVGPACAARQLHAVVDVRLPGFVEALVACAGLGPSDPLRIREVGLRLGLAADTARFASGVGVIAGRRAGGVISVRVDVLNHDACHPLWEEARDA